MKERGFRRRHSSPPYMAKSSRDSKSSSKDARSSSTRDARPSSRDAGRRRSSRDRHTSKEKRHDPKDSSRTVKDRKEADAKTSVSSQRTNEEEASQHLWVGNVSAAVTKTMLAEQFSRFGDIESLKLFSTKNYAFVSLKTIEDAVYAKKRLHGTVLGGLALRIEFARGDGKADNPPLVDEKATPAGMQSGSKITSQDGQKDGKVSTHEKKSTPVSATGQEDGSRQPSERPKSNKAGEPSEVLWIGFPLHLRIDEKKLHKLFAPFGGVEKITTFPGRTYAFVRFQSVKAASRAKDALQGKLFDDPRVSISFAKSEVGPVEAASNRVPSSPRKRFMERSASPSSPQNKDVRPAMVLVPHDLGLAEDKLPSKFHQGREASFIGSKSDSASAQGPSPLNSNVQPWLDVQAEGNLMSLTHEPKLHSDRTLNFLDKNNLEGWSMSGEEAVMREKKRPRIGELCEVVNPLSSSLSTIQEPVVLYEDGQLKRKRVVDDHSMSFVSEVELEKPDTYTSMGDWEQGAGQRQGLMERGSFTTSAEAMAVPLGSQENWENKESVQKGLLGKMPLSELKADQPVELTVGSGLPESPISPPPESVASPVQATLKDVFRWEGVIAKSGTEVCRCRCFPATKEIDVTFPDILNFTARTSLDMLAQHVSQVRDLAFVLFMPQAVADVPPYQELMSFLADKNRAAVCTLSDDNILFLVPPSDFVEQFLNVPRSNNILGVVLRQQQLVARAPPPEQTGYTDDDRKQCHNALTSLVHHQAAAMVMPAHSSAESRTGQPSLPLRSHESLGGEFAPPATAASRNFLAETSARWGNPQGVTVLNNNNRMLHQMEYGIQGSNLLLDGRVRNNRMPPDLHANKLVPIQNPGIPPHPPAFLASRSNFVAEHKPMPTPVYVESGMTRKQNFPGLFPHDEQPWPTAVPPSAILAQPNSTLRPPFNHLQPSFSYASRHAPQQAIFLDGSQQESQGPKLELAYKATGITSQSPATTSQLSHSSAIVKSSPQVASADEDREKQLVVDAAPKAAPLGQDGSDEEQKKFQATVELAAALLQQLQQQIKL